MCRMAAFLSVKPLKGYEVDDFLDALANVASRGRTGGDTGMGHPHGWGAVAFRQGRPILYVRETSPMWKRGFYARFRADLVLAHARAASIGEVSFDNTHPFAVVSKGKMWFLAHNGSIRGLENEEKGLIGKTDSEALLLRIIRLTDEVNLKSLADVFRRIKNEFQGKMSSMTSLLTSGSEIYALKGAVEKPDYFNLYIEEGESTVKISSQPLDNGTWEEVPNWTLCLFSREKSEITRRCIRI